MNFKRISAAVLALALTVPMALAEGLPAGWTPADGARTGLPEGAAWYGPAADLTPVADRYQAAVTVNGKALEELTYYDYDPETFEEKEITVSPDDLPGAPAGYVPMRLLCAADPTGFTDWYADERTAYFSFHKNSISVNFNENTVELNGEAIPGVAPYLAQVGVTFLPVDFLAALEDVEVDDHPELDTERYDFTLVVAPIVALANTIRDEAGCRASFEMDAETLTMMYELPEDAIREVAAYAPMMVNPDTIIIARVSDESKEAVMAALEAHRQQQVDTFTWYLVDQLPKAENGKVVAEGEYVMLFIGEDADLAVELFTAGVKEL